MSRRSQEAHPEVREGSGGPYGGLEGVRMITRRSLRPTRRSGLGRKSYLEV